MNRSRSCFRIASALGHIGTQKCLRIIDDLLVHRLIGLSKLENRMRSSRFRPGSHRRNVRSFQHEESRRSGPGTRGRYVHDHRDTRPKNSARHGAHRFQQPARSIHFDEQSSRAIGIRLGDGSLQFASTDRLNGIVQHKLVHSRCSVAAGAAHPAISPIAATRLTTILNLNPFTC